VHGADGRVLRQMGATAYAVTDARSGAMLPALRQAPSQPSVLASVAYCTGPAWEGRNVEQVPGPKMEVTRRQERIAFLLVTAVVFPLLAILVVAGYGFMVWMWQLLFVGPPTGP